MEPQSGHNELLNMGQKAYSAGDYVTALRYFVEASNFEPENVRIGEQIAGTLQALGRIDEAIQMYKKTAAGYLHQGSIIKAIAVHKTILSIHPNDQEIKNQLVSIFGSDIPKEFTEVVKTAAPVPTDHKKTTTSAKGKITAEDLGLDALEDENASAGEDMDQLNNVFAEILGEEAGLKEFGRIPSSGTPTDAILRTPLFCDLEPAELDNLIEKFEFKEYNPGEIICREGDRDQELWIIVRGEVEIRTLAKDGREMLLASLGEGDFFGEGGFVMAAPRTASVTAKTPLKLLRLSRSAFNEVAGRYPHLNKVLQLFHRNRLSDRIMAQSELFGLLPTFRRAELMQSFERKAFKAGEIILKAGDQEGNFHFIETGTVALVLKDQVFAQLKAGDFFGEGPGILKKPQAYEARALDDTQTLMLRKIDVVGIQQMFPEAETILQRVAKERDAKTLH